MGTLVSFRRRPPGEALAKVLPPDRLDAQWDRVAAGVHARRRRRAATQVGVLAAVVAAGTIVAIRSAERWWGGEATIAARQPVDVVAVGEARAITLAEGSRATLAPGSRLQVAREDVSDVRLAVVAGEVRFDVSHVQGRRFVVDAGPVLVHVVGTAFVVKVDAPTGRAEVRVERGRVRLEGEGGGRELGPGESWPAREAPSAVEVEPLPAARTEVRPEEDAHPAQVRRSTRAEPATPSPSGARGLFEAATRARAAGDARGAAALFDEVRRGYRTRGAEDRTLAGVSAFELGRLRLDVLGDAPGAVEAFRDTLRLPTSGLRDDVEARLVEALERAGDGAGCREARARYLRDHARGAHVEDVRGRCQRP